MARVLITGARGFVGTAVCRSLRSSGHLLSGTTRNSDTRASVDGTPLYVTPDIGPDTDWSRIVAGADIIVHLAARVHVMRESARNPLAEFRKTNVEGTRSLATAAAAAGVRRFIFMSSSKAMTERTDINGIDESAPPTPTDPYGISKLEAEEALEQVSRSTGLGVTVLRPPLVYGPGVTGNFLSLLKACDKRLPLPLGAIANRRSLIYVGNLADAVTRCVEDERTAGHTFIVSDDPPLSTPDLIRAVGDALGRRQRIYDFPVGILRLLGMVSGRTAALERLVDSLVIDGSQFRRTLDWQPPRSPEEGFAATAAWYRENR